MNPTSIIVELRMVSENVSTRIPMFISRLNEMIRGATVSGMNWYKVGNVITAILSVVSRNELMVYRKKVLPIFVARDCRLLITFKSA